MSHREGELYFAAELMLGDKIVQGMNAWNVDLTGSISEPSASNLNLQYIDLESRFIRITPVTRTLLTQWIFVVFPRPVN